MGRETLSGSSEGPKRWRATGAVVWDHEISEVLPPEARISSLTLLLLPAGTDGTKRPSSSLSLMASAAAEFSDRPRRTLASASVP